MNHSNSGVSLTLMVLFIFLMFILPTQVSLLAITYAGIIVVTCLIALLGIYAGFKISFKYTEAFKHKGYLLCTLNAFLFITAYFINPLTFMEMPITTKLITSLWFVILINLPLAIYAQKKLDADYEKLMAQYKVKPARSILKIY